MTPGALSPIALAILAPIALSIAAETPPKEPVPPEKEKAQTLVIKAARTLEFTTTEGTWMSVDVSPDGGTLLVDMLGDLYTVAAAGGELKQLKSGQPWDYQARYSADGKQIVFISDRDGSDNVWVMNADGSNPKAITKEKRYMFGSPAFSPDGQYIVARRYGSYPLESYLRKSELWLFNKDGGTGVVLVKGDGAFKRSAGPAFSPDGKYIYFSGSTAGFVYNSDLGKWQVQRFHRETGRIDAITSRWGGGLRPQVTPDGKTLIYAIRNDTETMLVARNLENRVERTLAAHITRDDQEGFAPEDTLPGYGVTRDGKWVFIAVDGKIRLATAKASDVPFTVQVKREMGKLVKFDSRIQDTPFAAKQLRWLQSSADGSKIVFQEEMRKLFDGIDILISPSRFGVASKISEPLDRPAGGASINRPADRGKGLRDLSAAGNLAGLPALSLPCGFADGMPVALSLVGRAFSENLLIAAGKEFQSLTDWHRRRPVA